MQDLSNILIVDPRQSELFSSANETYLIKKSAQTISYSSFDAQTKNVNQLTFNVQIPSKSIIVDRKIFIEMQLLVRLTGNRAANNYFYDGTGFGDATFDQNRADIGGGLGAAIDKKYYQSSNTPFSVRNNPLHTCCSVNSLYVNGLLISTTPQDYTAVFSMAQMYGTENQMMTGAFGGRERMQVIKGESGSIGNNTDLVCLGGATSNGIFSTPKNDDQVQIKLVNNTRIVGAPGQCFADFIVKWTEQVNIGPFVQPNVKRDAGGLVGINSLQFVYNTLWEKAFLVNNLNIVTQREIDGNFNTLKVLQVDKATMHCCFITPTPILGSFKNILHYNCPLYNNYLGNQNFTLSRTVPEVKQINNIQFSSIPSHLIIYVSKVVTDQLNNATVGTIAPNPPILANVNDILKTMPVASSGLAKIHSISINFNNQTSLLASASEFSLYQMSTRNMANYSWGDWAKRCGSVLVIDCARDLGQDPLSAVSTSGAYNFSASITCSDATDSIDVAGLYPSYQYQINVLTLEDAVLEITPSTTRLSSSFDISTVLQAVASGNVDVSQLSDGNSVMAGSAWYNNISDLKASIRPWAQRVSSYLPEAQKAYDNSFIKPLLPKSYQKNINKGFTLSNAAMALVNKLLGEGMSGGQIKNVMKGQMDPAEMEALREYLKSYKGSALEGGAKVAKKRLVKKY